MSSTTTITAEYRDLKRVGFFACHACVRRIVMWASLPTVVIATVLAVVCGIAAIYFNDSALLRWSAIAGMVLAGLTAVAFVVMSLFPGVDVWTSDGAIRDKAAPLLKQQGKGNSFFTQREYDLLFVKKAADRPETAEDLLAGLEDDEEESNGRGSPEAGSTKFCRFCAGRIPSYAQACPLCKKILV